ncbi:protein GRAVITROPIC IN THE LIGHT 1 [Wolffia australiana]
MKLCRGTGMATPAKSDRSRMMRAISKIALFRRAGLVRSKPKPPEYSRPAAAEDEEATLSAEVFAAVAAVKAEYAQLQVAQSPFDADSVQSCDRAIVSHLQRLSQLKQAHLKKLPLHGSKAAAELQEQRSLVKTFEITSKKLESELGHKDAQILQLKAQLSDVESHGGFLAALRRAGKAVRALAAAMAEEMAAAGWDVAAAAGAVAPEVKFARAEDRGFAFESFVARVLFSGFHLPDFGLGHGGADVAELTRAKYRALVHPSMEAFLGAESRFGRRFAEAGRRVWLLHRLFFSTDSPAERHVFQVRPGTRFSEVYMQSVVEGGGGAAVGFTVFPGFRLGRTIVQCKVYPAR